MSAERAGGLVCGFFDLAGGLGGLAWELGSRGGLVLSADEVRPAEVEISEGEGKTEIGLATAEGKLEATLTPRVAPVNPKRPDQPAPPGGELQAALCSAAIGGPAAGRSRQCSGHLSRWPQDPSAGTGAFRHLAVEAPEGALILVVSVGAPGAAHGEEEVCAWLLGAEGGESAYGEAFLSTQYDEAGRQTRMGLELWPQGTEQVDRAGATRGAGTALGPAAAGGAISAALMHCSVEGTNGLGSYLIRRG
jgi:hypothetical protein